MSEPRIGSPHLSTHHDAHTDATNGVTAKPPAKATTTTDKTDDHQVQPWAPNGGAFFQPSSDGASLTPAEARTLAAHSELAKQHQVDEGLSSVQPSLDRTISDLAKGQPAHRATAAFVDALSSRAEFKDMIESLPKERICAALEERVRAKCPHASDAEVRKIVGQLSKEIDEFVRVDAGQRLQRGVSGKLTEAAGKFEAAAQDGKELARTLSALQELEAPPRTEERSEKAKGVRLALGLPDTGRVDVATLKASLLEHAKLMRLEAKRVADGGEVSLYRSLKLHSAMNEALLDAQGKKPDSWGARGAEAVHRRGERDEADIANVKFLCSLALAATGVGAPAVIAFNAPHLNALAADRDRAKAGISAGTAGDQALSAANRKLVVSAAETGISAAVAGKPDFEANGLHRLRHVVVEGAIGQGAMAIEHAIEPAEQKSKGDGLSRTKP